MQLNVFPHVNLCKCFCTEGGIIIIKAVLCILRKLSYLGLVTPSLRVEDTHLSSLIISIEVFVFLSSQFLSKLNCTD